MRSALFLICGALFAEVGTAPRPSPDAWPARMKVGESELAAEFNVRTVVLRGKSIWVKRHLVVEVCVYPPRGGTTVHASQFLLRLNGSRGVLYNAAPSSAAVFVRNPEYGGGTAWEADIGGVSTGSEIGRTRRGRMPSPIPPPPRTPGGQREDGTPPEDADLVIDAALPQGPTKEPVSGYLYFYWDGKTQKLKTVELLYTPPGASEPVVLRLR